MSNRVSTHQKFFQEIPTDVGLLVSLNAELRTDIVTAGSSELLAKKMSGLAKIGRMLEITKSSKILEIVQAFRLTEMPADHKLLQQFEHANPKTQAALSVIDVLKKLLPEVEGDNIDQGSPKYGNAIRKIVDAMHLLEPLVSNHQQAWLALHHSRLMSLLLNVCELLRTALLHTHAKKAGQMARLALSMLAQMTLQQEGRVQLLSLEIPQSRTHFVLIIINLMQTDWSESLDHNQSLDLVESGFRTLRQMTLTSEVQRFVHSFPSLMLDLSDMILLYADTPSILKEIKGLMFNFRSIKALPAHLEQLIKNDVA